MIQRLKKVEGENSIHQNGVFKSLFLLWDRIQEGEDGFYWGYTDFSKFMRYLIGAIDEAHEKDLLHKLQTIANEYVARVIFERNAHSIMFNQPCGRKITEEMGLDLC